MNKKVFTAPRIELIRLMSQDILCTSPQSLGIGDEADSGFIMSTQARYDDEEWY